MDVTNTTGRDIFWGDKDRRLQDVEEARRGIRFPAGETITVPDAVRLSKSFDLLVLAGKLVIEDFSDDPTSTVQQEELDAASGLDNLVEVEFVPTDGQTLFILPVAYAAGGFARAKVNGVWYDKTDFFTISGTTFLWLDNGFALDSGDELLVWYETD